MTPNISPPVLYDQAHAAALRVYGDRENVLTRDVARTKRVIDDCISYDHDDGLARNLECFSKVVNVVLDGNFRLRVARVIDSDKEGNVSVGFTDNVGGASELFVPSMFHACRVLGCEMPSSQEAGLVVSEYSRNSSEDPYQRRSVSIADYGGFRIAELGRLRGFTHNCKVPFPCDEGFPNRVLSNIRSFKSFVERRVRDPNAPILYEIEWAIMQRYNESVRKDGIGQSVADLQLKLEGKEI